MICVAVVLLRRVRRARQPARCRPTAAGVALARLGDLLVGWVVLYLGTVVTGSGPHAGDAEAPAQRARPAGRSASCTPTSSSCCSGSPWRWCSCSGRADAPRRLRDAATLLLVVELAQGVRRVRAVLHRAPGRAGGPAPAGRGPTAAATWLLRSAPAKPVPTAPASPVQEPATRRPDPGRPQPSAGEQRVEGDREEQQREVHVRPVEEPHRAHLHDVVGPRASAGAAGAPRSRNTAPSTSAAAG